MSHIEHLPLRGEGETKTVIYKRCRAECDECGEVAHFKHAYLLRGARINPRSSAYGKDDCSWCEDTKKYTCKECKRPALEGYEWCSTMEAGDRFAHVFLRWIEVPADEAAVEQQIGRIG